jgi:hypothetical protein
LAFVLCQKSSHLQARAGCPGTPYRNIRLSIPCVVGRLMGPIEYLNSIKLLAYQWLLILNFQNNLVWNVSPHMSSSLEPPILYVGSFWSESDRYLNASAVIYSATSSLLHFENKIFSSTLKERLLQRWRCSCKLTSRRIFKNVTDSLN